jgi:hypothetical protein
VRSRDVVGRRIVAVQQERFWNQQTGRTDVNVVALVLDDGTRVYPITIETCAGYAHDLHVQKPKKDRLPPGQNR